MAGPVLPRKQTALARSRSSLESVAFQIGVIVAVERNRNGLTQEDLADKVDLRQIDISAIENGQPPPSTASNKSIDKVFRLLGLGSKSAQANFVKWWRDNSTL